MSSLEVGNSTTVLLRLGPSRPVPLDPLDRCALLPLLLLSDIDSYCQSVDTRLCYAYKTCFIACPGELEFVHGNVQGLGRWSLVVEVGEERGVRIPRVWVSDCRLFVLERVISIPFRFGASDENLTST